MIFVSGTKRSGTSMWMQVMKAAGIPILGQAFPRNWGQSALRQANPDGFYETLLRNGIYFHTNPHPQTGRYFMPEDVAGFAVKVFIPGVVRSERAYITHLVANVREWREYEASLGRLHALEAQDRPDGLEPPAPFPAAYEWWMENFALVRDITLRKLPASLQTYEQVLDDPQRVIERVLGWIGQGDVEAAVAAVKPERRTQERPTSQSVDPALAQVFDDLYAAIEAGKGISGALLKTLNDTNMKLLPELKEIQLRVIHEQAEFQKKLGHKPQPIAITGLPGK